MSTASESSPLLRKPPQRRKHQKHCSCNVNYRLPMITEKGAIVMIVRNALLCIAVFGQIQRLTLKSITTVAFTVMPFITFPIVGIAADTCTCVGRFKTIQAGVVLLMASSLLNILLILLQDFLPAIVETICVLYATGLCCTGASCYVANAFPFLADQLIGASGEQLSFAVYWIMWGLGNSYYPILLKSVHSDYFDIVVEALSFVCLSMTALIFNYFKYLFAILPQLFNPYKIIFQSYELCSGSTNILRDVVHSPTGKKISHLA